MARLTREKVLTIRNNADNLLKKMEADEKNEWKKLAYGNQEIKATNEKILSLLANSKTEEKMVAMMREMRKEMGEAINVSRPDLTPLSQAILQLQKVVAESVISKTSDTSAKDLLKALGEIKKELGKNGSVTDRTDEIVEAIRNISVEAPKLELPTVLPVTVENWQPQKFPQPATNISINSLKGFVHTTSTTINSTTVTALPGYGVLANRRSLIIYNNSTQTIYIGGSGVTASNGMPIPQKSYSSPIDAGPNMLLYGISTSGSADVRCLEVSDIASGR